MYSWSAVGVIIKYSSPYLSLYLSPVNTIDFLYSATALGCSAASAIDGTDPNIIAVLVINNMALFNFIINSQPFILSD